MFRGCAAAAMARCCGAFAGGSGRPISRPRKRYPPPLIAGSPAQVAGCVPHLRCERFVAVQVHGAPILTGRACDHTGRRRSSTPTSAIIQPRRGANQIAERHADVRANWTGLVLAAVDGVALGRFTREHAQDHQPPLTLPPMRFFMDSGLAEGVGFEPTVDFHPRRFSRPLP